MTAPISNGPTTHGYTTMRDATASVTIFALQAKKCPKLAFFGVLGEFCTGCADEGPVLGEFCTGVAREEVCRASFVPAETWCHDARGWCELAGGPIGRNQVGEPRGSIQTARARRFWSPLSNFACNSLRASCLFVPVGNVASLVLWNCMRLS